MPLFWLQGLIALAIWIAYGVRLARRPEAMRAFASGTRRSVRGFLAAGLLVLAVIVLFGVLSGVLVFGGFGEKVMTPLGWVTVVLAGLAFVHLQTLALALGMSLAQEAVTQAGPAASATMEPSQDHENHRPA